MAPSYSHLPSTISAEPPPDIGLLSLLAEAPSGSSQAAANLFILVQLGAIAFAVWAIARYCRGKVARALTWDIARSVDDPYGHARRQLAAWETDVSSLHEMRNMLRGLTARVRPHSLCHSPKPVDPEPVDPEFETARNMLMESFGRRRRAPPTHSESMLPHAPLSIQLLGAVCPWYLTDWYQMARRRDSSRPDGEPSISTPSAAPSTLPVHLLEPERRKWAAAAAARPQTDGENPSTPLRTPPPELPPRTLLKDGSKNPRLPNPRLPFFESATVERGSPSFPQRLEAQQVLGVRDDAAASAAGVGPSTRDYPVPRGCHQCAPARLARQRGCHHPVSHPIGIQISSEMSIEMGRGRLSSEPLKKRRPLPNSFRERPVLPAAGGAPASLFQARGACIAKGGRAGTEDLIIFP